MVKQHQVGRIAGLTIFLIIDIIIAFIFVNIRDDPGNVLCVLNQDIIFSCTPAPDRDFIFDSADLLLTLFYVAILFVVQVLFNWGAAFRDIKKEQKIKFYPELPSEKESKSAVWGKYTPQQLMDLVDKTAEKAGVTIKDAYLETSVIPRIDSYSFMGRHIYINSNLLQICGEKELEAAIAVEIGFTGQVSSLITYLNHNFRAFVGLLYLIPFLYLGRAILLTWLNSGAFTFEINRVIVQLFFLVGLLIITLILTSIHSIPINWANKQVQFVADHLAVGFVGKRIMINMLVKLGQRTEALDVLLEEIKWLESLEKGKIYGFDEERLMEILPLFPADELSEDVARELAPSIFIQSRLKSLMNFYYFSIPDLEDRVEHSAKILQQKRKEFLEDERKIAKEAGQEMKTAEEETIDWRQADTDGNLDLDEEEIKVFVQSLKDNPNKLLFENEILKDALFRRRLPAAKQILFVYDL